MLRRTILTIILVLSCAPASARGGNASSEAWVRNTCTATRPPRISYEYTADVMEISATFETIRCRRGGSFETSFIFDQQRIVGGQGIAGGGGCFERSLKRCVVRIGLPHRRIEKATYKLELDYKGPDGRETAEAEYACTSAAVSASCE
jgi:hypothetical protein